MSVTLAGWENVPRIRGSLSKYVHIRRFQLPVPVKSGGIILEPDTIGPQTFAYCRTEADDGS